MRSASTVLAAESRQFEAPGLWLFEWKPLFHIGPVAVTKPMVLALLAAATVIFFFWTAFRKPKLVPRGVQNVGELAYLFVRDQIARSMIGKQGDRYVPLLVSLFFLIWIMNFLSVVPVAQFPVTSRIAYPIIFALLVYALMLALFFKHQGPGFLLKVMFPPGLPKAIYPLLAPIELFSTFLIRPFTHAVRLFANMFAGHTIIALFSIAAYHFIAVHVTLKGLPVGVIGFVMAVLLVVFELLIQFLQAYIFVMLTAFYISDAREH